MEIFEDPRAVRAAMHAWMRRGASVGFVPTMGALHAGHLALVDAARKENDAVCVSIFVNPAQFGANEDYARYPRTIEADCALLENRTDYLFLPTPAVMYPHPPQVVLTLPELGAKWEGAARPNHFAGVALIVAKLFNLIRPQRAYFGRKDLQQTVIVRRLVEDLNMDVEIRVLDTVREPDGLAMSSRNRMLSEEARRHAPRLFQTLLEFRRAIRQTGDAARAKAYALEYLRQAPFEPDYLALVEDDTLEEVFHPRPDLSYSVIAAARLEGIRLIDNLPFQPSRDDDRFRKNEV
jgi:pantoate--beta-alanine ligase